MVEMLSYQEAVHAAAASLFSQQWLRIPTIAGTQTDAMAGSCSD